MHRSGTSVITRALGALGAALGPRLLPALPCRAVMVIREELFRGQWVETCRKLVDVRGEGE